MQLKPWMLPIRGFSCTEFCFTKKNKQANTFYLHAAHWWTVLYLWSMQFVMTMKEEMDTALIEEAVIGHLIGVVIAADQWVLMVEVQKGLVQIMVVVQAHLLKKVKGAAPITRGKSAPIMRSRWVLVMKGIEGNETLMLTNNLPFFSLPHPRFYITHS